MDIETARTILFLITGIGIVAWMGGVRFLVASRRAGKPAIDDRFDLPDHKASQSKTFQSLIFGTAEVDGEPAALADRAATALAKGTGLPFGPLKILEKSERQLRFEGGLVDPSGKGVGQLVRRGQLQFTRQRDDRTTVDYGVEISGGRGLLIGGAVCLSLGLIALIVGFVLINQYVVSSPKPAVRGQTFQMLQTIHFLWPPFLFGWLYQLRFRAVRGAFDTFVHNLPYTDQ